MNEYACERGNKKGTKDNKMDQNDQNGATIREDRRRGGKKKNRERERVRETAREQKKRRNKGKVRKWQEGGVFNICFHGNQPTILRLRHLLS